MIKSIFNEELQVLEVTYDGDISSEDITKHALLISKSEKLPPKLKILTDARNANYTFAPNSVYKLLEILILNLQKYEFIKDAFIHSKPKETAYSTLIEIEQQHRNYSHRIFSSKKAALDWLR